MKISMTYRNCSVTRENILARPVSSTNKSSSVPDMKIACRIRGIGVLSNHFVMVIAPPRAVRLLLVFS